MPSQLKDAYIGGEYRRFSVTLDSGLDNDELFPAIDDIRAAAGEYLGQSYVTGSYAVAADMASTAERDYVTVELVSIAFIFFILLVAFRSLTVPLLLVIVIKAAIYINVGINYFFRRRDGFFNSSVRRGDTAGRNGRLCYSIYVPVF